MLNAIFRFSLARNGSLGRLLACLPHVQSQLVRSQELLQVSNHLSFFGGRLRFLLALRGVTHTPLSLTFFTPFDWWRPPVDVWLPFVFCSFPSGSCRKDIVPRTRTPRNVWLQQQAMWLVVGCAGAGGWSHSRRLCAPTAENLSVTRCRD